MQRVRVKICGITRAEDGLSAVRAGTDAIGLVFYPPSKRAVDVKTAAGIVSQLPPFITKVGLFVDATPAEIEAVLNEVRLDMLQFHGNETQDQCLEYGIPFIKAIKMKENTSLTEKCSEFDGAAGLLLDTHVPGMAGGTGRTFDWESIEEGCPKPLILAGGLNPANVYDAIQCVRPYAVDVSGGVESGPGIKDAGKIMEFINNVRNSL